MFYNIVTFVFVFAANSVFSGDIAVSKLQSLDDIILCRNCGSDISSSNHITYKSSPEAQHVFNDTIFSKDGVVVQMLIADFFFYVPVVTVTRSTCKPVGEWTQSESFPDYIWKLCVCPDCGASVGWVFHPINPYRKEVFDSFFGLLLYGLIGKNCEYTLIFGYRFPDPLPSKTISLTMALETMSAADREFLANCEEELKDRYTDKDEEFMKVFNAEPSKPPIISSWWIPQNSGRRNDRRFNRRSHPYERYGNRDHDRRDHDRRDYDRRDNHHDRRDYGYQGHGHGYRSQRPRY